MHPDSITGLWSKDDKQKPQLLLNLLLSPPAQSQRSPSPSQPSGKGEDSDLKLQLQQHAGSRAPGADDAKRELFKKAISYMTIGIDVSSLFGDMVMCSMTPDIVLEKMCYHYVGNYPDTRVVANCLSSLQEIWSLEASTFEEASRERGAARIHHKKKWKEAATTHSPLSTSTHHEEGSTIKIWRGIRPRTHGKV